ncbi:SOS response-associated peptidase [Jeotgalibacillus sp. S-D1]|uniref:SOS response-associated peptidase n=1 Tax=Jeotgalibacillus sp. S-D1 TaxID=2552189 RepID=UPI00105A4DB9|nr:SOS response-associated peptidase [Jeotgalibacillus sp. S-D1]TDL30732.1 SOS response-associated peptidase [Jeotgalibacillus sp. S-D1]
MCGRFSLTEKLAELQAHYEFEMREEFSYEPNDNISPSQQIMAVVEVDKIRYPVQFRWGLIPPFAKDEKIGYKTFNARSETVQQKPSFRKAFQKKRCLIPADSFYEWQKLSSKEKQPFAIKPASNNILTFAGLWESWHKGNEVIRSCTILTTRPNSKMESIHDRMPVILKEDDYQSWLSADTNADELQSLLQPCRDEYLTLDPVPNDFFKRKKA